MNKNHQVLNDIDQSHFRGWIELNVNSITWEGRYTGEFERFWEHLFPSDIFLRDQVHKLKFAKEVIKTGPLTAWFQWLIDKLICYCFIHKPMSIAELADTFECGPSEVALTLRDFFVQRFPHLEELFNDEFRLGNYSSKRTSLTFEELKEHFDIGPSIRGTLEDDVLSSLEVTLYQDWTKLIEIFHKENTVIMTADTVKKRYSSKKRWKTIQEVVLLFITGGVVIFGLKAGNKWYEDYLANKITIFEPNFFWLNKSLTFKSRDPLKSKEIDLSYRELDELEKAEANFEFDEEDEELRFKDESDVTITSVDALPKDIAVASLEQSDYEENKKGGYRNFRYGRQKAYRVMMTSVDPLTTSEKIKPYLQAYKVEKADNVKPGTQIPGGVYFNLYVPREHLRDFLGKVSAVEEATILESQTRFAGEPGKNKVFIWIKSI